MNLQKLIATRAVHGKVAEGQQMRITTELCSEEINAIVERILEKVALLKQLNEKILSQTGVTYIENKIFDTEKYMIDLESGVRKARREFMRQAGTRNDATPTDSAFGMANIREDNNNSTVSQHSVRSEVSFPTSITSSALQLRLPKLKFPTFSGKILELPTFLDSFESSIHLNSALPDIKSSVIWNL